MSSGKLTARDREIIDHIGRVGLTFKEVVEHLFFSGKDSQKVLDRLRAGGHIKPLKGFGGNRSAYARADDDFGSQALPDRLALLAFCYLCGTSRVPLKRAELKALFAGEAPKGRYAVLERQADGPLLHHLYIPGETKRPRDAAEHAFGQFLRTFDDPKFRGFFLGGRYVYSVLVQSEERAERIRRELRKRERAHGASAHLKAKLAVHVIPAPHQFEEALDALAKKEAK